MSEILVSITRDADPGEFCRDLDRAGVRFEELPAIRFTLIVHDTTVEEFPLRDHPAVVAVDPGDASMTPFARQVVRFDATNGIARWPLVRHVMRDAPWSRDRIILPFDTVFECSRTGAGVDVYMIDGGVRKTHAEFAGRTVTTVYKASSSEVDDVNGHGTLCLSAAAGKTCGFAREANLFDAQFWTGGVFPSGDFANAARAVSQSITHWLSRSSEDTPGVANISFGSVGQTMASVCAEAASYGFVLVAAVGNDILDLRKSPIGPALTDRVLTVGGVAMDDRPYYTGRNGSNYSDQVDVLAGSQGTYVANFSGDDRYAFEDGTSLGCGYVTGIVACMLQGYRRPTSEAQVMSLHRYIRDQATYGRLRRTPGRQTTLRDGIIYLDPRPIDQVPPIPGLTRR